MSAYVQCRIARQDCQEYIMSVATLRRPRHTAPDSTRPTEPSLVRLGRVLTTPGHTLHWGEVVAFALLATLMVMVAYWPVVFGGRTLTLGAIWTGVLPTGPYGYPEPRVVPQVTDPLGFYIRAPWAGLAARLWTHGQVPLWDPFLG